MPNVLKLIVVGMIACFAYHPALAEKKPSATKQLQKANEGPRQRDHVFDGRRAQPNAVRAQSAKKPSMVGRRASEFRPKYHAKPTKPPPSPK